jgi:hypothetical protein
MFDIKYLIEALVLSVVSLCLIITYSIQIRNTAASTYLTWLRRFGLIGACFMLLTNLDNSAVMFMPMFLPKYFRIFCAFFVVSELLIYVYYQLDLIYHSVGKDVPFIMKIILIITLGLTVIIYISANILQDITNKSYPNAFGNLATMIISIMVGVFASIGYFGMRNIIDNKISDVKVGSASSTTKLKLALTKLRNFMIIFVILSVISALFQCYRGLKTFEDKVSQQYIGNPETYTGFDMCITVLIFPIINGILIIAIWTKNIKPKPATTTPVLSSGTVAALFKSSRDISTM